MLVSGITSGLITCSTIALLSLLFFLGNWWMTLLAFATLIINVIIMLGSISLLSRFTSYFLLFVVQHVCSLLLFLFERLFYVFGWSLGAIEAISITILVGLSVDYVYHLAHAYTSAQSKETEHKQYSLFNNDSNDSLDSGWWKPRFHTSNAQLRYQFMRYALRRMGVSVISGALTTVLSAALLLFCTLVIFRRFGIIVTFNISISFLLTFFLFPALMFMMGPVGHFGQFYIYFKR
jgi:PERQ amino acid-rich with GYF domain-containing protein